MLEWLIFSRPSKTSSCLLYMLHIVAIGFGLWCQVASLFSGSWVRADRSVYPYWDSLRNKVVYDAKANTTSWYVSEEIARAGLWEVCYLFPHLPESHTDPYCAVFFDDHHQEHWLTMVQIVSLLSPILSVMGSFHLVMLVPVCCYMETFHWLGCRLLVVGGSLGLLTVCLFHANVTREFIVYYDSSPYNLIKEWGYFVYLDGSLIHLALGLLCLRYGALDGLTVRRKRRERFGHFKII